jgi:carbamoyl-phosphate synthase large subunit
MVAAGLQVPVSEIVTSRCQTPGRVPAIVRPAFTLGGSGGGIARTPEELEERIAAGLAASPVGQVLVEESLEGWQEFELEVMADTAGNCVVVCSIENLDPMGVHTGDSWTVAPQQTLPDAGTSSTRAAFTCARAVGVATGGADVQFAYEPESRELRVIEMNPRVSRSSALASKATGFPIAKIAALLAIGYTLDELPNDITQQTTAAFEPALDYVAVKAPRFDFDKFPAADDRLGSGCAPSAGRSGSAARSPRRSSRLGDAVDPRLDLHRRGEAVPERWDLLLEAARQELDLPGIHPYFAAELHEIAAAERRVAEDGDILAAKRFGLPDAAIASALGIDEAQVRALRPLPGRLAVDSCAAEFEARRRTYLSYEPSDDEPAPTGRAIVVLGSGRRIGQGIEFDYCCVHAVRTFQALGYEAVMLNPNPETVSTDYDTSDRLYLEPLTLERALDVCALEQPLGVVVSFGGQTPLRLAPGLVEAGVPLLGDPLAAIDAAEDRVRFAELLGELGLNAPTWRRRRRLQALAAAAELGYPVLVRPHHVIGGRGIHVARNPDELDVRAVPRRSLPGQCGGARRRRAATAAMPGLRQSSSTWARGSHSGDRPSSSRAERDAGARAGRSATPHADRARPRRPRPAEPPARARGRRAVRPRGEPARLAHGPVRSQGDRAAARRARLPPAPR